MTVSASALDLLTLLRRKGIGPRGAVKLIEGRGGGDAERIEASRDDRDAVVALAEDCSRLGVGVVGWFDEAFPNRLRGIPNPPAVLFYRGDIAVAGATRSVAIVGTRDPTDWGRRTTRTVADRFVEDGWVIVSGLALGVDTIAHESAIERRVPTVAILGNGLASVYPTANRQLAEQIVEGGGLLLAEVPPHARVEPRALVKRDRLQSGLAALTVVCQGGRTSGAMHTARFAVEQGRAVYVPVVGRDNDVVDEQDEGTQALLTEPPARLGDLLPAWRAASRRVTGGSAPVALPLDESLLARLDWIGPSGDNTYEPPRLF